MGIHKTTKQFDTSQAGIHKIQEVNTYISLKRGFSSFLVFGDFWLMKVFFFFFYYLQNTI